MAGDDTPLRREILDAAVDLQWECSKEDPWFFLTNLAYTLDEHDPANPYKLFPSYEYLEIITRTLEVESYIALPKSRQLMISWLVVGFCLWWALTKSGQLILFQSKKEADAARLITRTWGIYERLPESIRAQYPAERNELRIKFVKHDGVIEGIPEGPDQIRSMTPSVVFSDEIAFQDYAEQGLAAALPAIQGTNGRTGKLILVSSAAPGCFHDIVRDA